MAKDIRSSPKARGLLRVSNRLLLEANLLSAGKLVGYEHESAALMIAWRAVDEAFNAQVAADEAERRGARRMAG